MRVSIQLGAYRASSAIRVVAAFLCAITMAGARVGRRDVAITIDIPGSRYIQRPDRPPSKDIVVTHAAS